MKFTFLLFLCVIFIVNDALVWKNDSLQKLSQRPRNQLSHIQHVHVWLLNRCQIISVLSEYVVFWIMVLWRMLDIDRYPLGWTMWIRRYEAILKYNWSDHEDKTNLYKVQGPKILPHTSHTRPDNAPTGSILYSFLGLSR